MIQFKQILCPIDFSDTSTRALAYARAFAVRYGAELEVLHVRSAFDDAVPAAAPSAGQAFYPEPQDEILRQMRHAIDDAGAAGSSPRLSVLEGPIHDVIVERAGALPADLLVVGTHGRSGFNRLLLGSVTEQIVRTATCPVLTVPPAAPGKAESPTAFKEILCPLDYSASALKALRYALELGRQANARVTALHVLEYMDPQDPPDWVDAGVRRTRQRIIDSARQRLHEHLLGEPRTWCEIEEMVSLEQHRADHQILQHASTHHTDLIVMGAQGSGGIELMLYGSNTQGVVRGATCPVLTVRA